MPTSNSSSKIGVNASHRMLRFFHPLIKLSPTNLIFHGKPCRNRARRRNEKKNGKFTKRVNACCTTKGGERERREKTEKKGLKGPRRGPAGSIRALLRAAWCGTKRNGRVLLSHLEEKNSFATDISGKRLDWIREEQEIERFDRERAETVGREQSFHLSSSSGEKSRRQCHGLLF